MKRFVVDFLEKITKMLKTEEENITLQTESEVVDIEILTLPPQTLIRERSTQLPYIHVNKLKRNKKNLPTQQTRKKIPKDVSIPFIRDARDIRDVMELMEIPFVSLSKNRTTPIVYESPDGKSKVKISCHTGHYLASIYDWDIVLLISSKLQEFVNSGSDVPSRTLVIPRYELLKEIYKHNGKTNKKQIEESLARLQLTGIETTIHNEDYRYRGGFGFLDNWGYTERKDIKEFRITLSEWLYEIICSKGSLLKVHPEYFKITSGLKKFLYRTARKHVGVQNESWEFSIETLYKKSGSEREFKKFKYDLKKAIEENSIPGYLLQWIEKDDKTYVRFFNMQKEVRKMLRS